LFGFSLAKIELDDGVSKLLTAIFFKSEPLFHHFDPIFAPPSLDPSLEQKTTNKTRMEAGNLPAAAT
jgi:hypothetical protein